VTENLIVLWMVLGMSVELDVLVKEHYYNAIIVAAIGLLQEPSLNVPQLQNISFSIVATTEGEFFV
jgi:hypothetical protein